MTCQKPVDDEDLGLSKLPILYKETARCTGHCCKAFQINWTPEELKQAADDERENKPGRKMVEDIIQLHDMLIYLGYGLAKEFVEGGSTEVCKRKAHYFTCKHLQPNGDCGSYENRPGMCRRFGNVDKCDYKACTRSVERAPATKVLDDDGEDAIHVQDAS